MGRDRYFFSLGVRVKGYTEAYTWIFPGVFINFAGPNSKAAMGRVACFYAPQKINMATSLRERTAQNARSFKLSDRFERCANSFL